MASRLFSSKQAYEREVKDIYVRATGGAQTAATATLDLTVDVVLTSVATGDARNTTTFTTQVAAAAANPTNTILAVFTGTAAAITVTITPNDGTNNGAVPVNFTTANLTELINTGAVAGKSITVTDASSLRALQTATGGGPQNMVDGGQGDGVVATFSGGAVSDMSIATYAGIGVTSIARTSAGIYVVTLDEDVWASIKYAKITTLDATARDLQYQITVDLSTTAKTFTFNALTGTAPTEIGPTTSILMKLEVKSSTEQ